MVVIGLTGGIASGKSTVSQMLREKGATVIEADKVGHEVYQPGSPGWREVVATFGPTVVGDGGNIDRSSLGEIVFRDPEALRRLNAITHPRMKAIMAQQVQDLKEKGTPVVVLEAAVLIEAEWLSLVDEVWLTALPPETAVKRLVDRNGLPPAEAWARIRSQIGDEERRRYAKVVIDTDCPLEAVKQQVDASWADLMARAGQEQQDQVT